MKLIITTIGTYVHMQTSLYVVADIPGEHLKIGSPELDRRKRNLEDSIKRAITEEGWKLVEIE